MLTDSLVNKNLAIQSSPDSSGGGEKMRQCRRKKRVVWIVKGIPIPHNRFCAGFQHGCGQISWQGSHVPCDSAVIYMRSRIEPPSRQERQEEFAKARTVNPHPSRKGISETQDFIADDFSRRNPSFLGALGGLAVQFL
jgi:hypothetical protein